MYVEVVIGMVVESTELFHNAHGRLCRHRRCWEGSR